jgi:hypothetical protein
MERVSTTLNLPDWMVEAVREPADQEKRSFAISPFPCRFPARLLYLSYAAEQTVEILAGRPFPGSTLPLPKVSASGR